ncbi:unnamed protein product [Calypogeia fissa]
MTQDRQRHAGMIPKLSTAIFCGSPTGGPVSGRCGPTRPDCSAILPAPLLILSHERSRPIIKLNVFSRLLLKRRSGASSFVVSAACEVTTGNRSLSSIYSSNSLLLAPTFVRALKFPVSLLVSRMARKSVEESVYKVAGLREVLRRYHHWQKTGQSADITGEISSGVVGEPLV